MEVGSQTMTRLEATRLIQQAFSLNGVGIRYTEHAEDRMDEREISLRHAGKNGFVQRDPVFSDRHNNFECRVQHYYAGFNYVVCVGISRDVNGAIVITVWEVGEE